MPVAPKPDVLDLKDDGTIVLGFDDTHITLRRPKTGELKSFLLNLEQIRKDAKTKYARPDDAPDEITDEETEQLRERLIGDVDVLSPWMAETIGTLATNGQRLPESPEDWPVWLTNGDNVARFIAHWRSNPLVPGSK